MSQNSDRLALYYAAEKKILDGQVTKVADRELGLPDLRWVQNEIKRLEGLVAQENPAPGTGGGFKVASFASRGGGE